MQTYHGTYQTFELPADVSAAFGRLCQQEGVTPFMGLLAAFQAFLSRYSGQDDIAVGTPIANRTRPESEPLIGFFVNTLVMRGDLSGNPSFRELLQRTREAALGAYAHQDVPFEMVVDAVQPQRDMSHSPLFQAMLVVENASNRAIRMPGLTLEALEADPGTAKFDITLTVAQEPDGLRGAWEYNTDLFEAATVERMARQFGQLLAGLVAAPDRAVDAVPLLTAAERAEIVAAWNDTAADYPADCCASELFEQQVARTPDAVAVVYGEETLTYAALNRRANQLARYLRKRGVGPEVLVGLCVERAPEALVGMLAVLKVGGAYLPLDPGYPPERLAYMLADARVPVLLTQARLMERLPQFGGETLRLDADWPMIAQEAEENLPSVADPGNLAYVIYTSGSTGRPKGVMITRSGLSNYLDWVRRAYPLEQGVGAPVHSSLAFDLTVTGLFGPLVAGGRVELIPEAAGVEGLGEALRQAREPYSLVKLTPAHLEMLAQQLGPENAAERTRAFIIGGGEPAGGGAAVLAAACAGDGVGQRVWPYRDGGRLLRVSGAGRRAAGRIGVHWASDHQYAVVRAGRAVAAGSRGGSGGAIHRGRGGSAGLPGEARANGGAVCAGPVQWGSGGTAVQDGGCSAVSGGRESRVLGAAGRPGEGAGFPHRAGGDRGGAARVRGGARRGGGSAGGRAGATAAGGVCGARRPASRHQRTAGTTGADAAGVYGSLGLCLFGVAAADAEWKGRPQGVARARSNAGGIGERVCCSAHAGGRVAGGHLGAGVGRGTGGRL
jgi:non-ribosomal peptide synthetase component F